MSHVPTVVIGREMASRAVYIASMAGQLHQRLEDGFYDGNLTLKGQAEAHLQSCEDKVAEANEEFFDTIEILEIYFPPE